MKNVSSNGLPIGVYYSPDRAMKCAPAFGATALIEGRSHFAGYHATAEAARVARANVIAGRPRWLPGREGELLP